MKYVVALVSICLCGFTIQAQERPLDMKMDFEQYDPPSTLKVEEHRLAKSKFPFIDIHNHYGNMNTADLSDRVRYMDQLNMGVMVNLSGRGFRSSGDHLEKSFEDWNSNPTRWEHPNESRDGRILFENFLKLALAKRNAK